MKKIYDSINIYTMTIGKSNYVILPYGSGFKKNTPCTFVRLNLKGDGLFDDIVSFVKRKAPAFIRKHAPKVVEYGTRKLIDVIFDKFNINNPELEKAIANATSKAVERLLPGQKEMKKEKSEFKVPEVPATQYPVVADIMPPRQEQAATSEYRPLSDKDLQRLIRGSPDEDVVRSFMDIPETELGTSVMKSDAPSRKGKGSQGGKTRKQPAKQKTTKKQKYTDLSKVLS